MMLERTDLGWLMYDLKLKKKYFLNSTQISEIMTKLEHTEFKRVYFSKKNPNDLVIELCPGDVIIKNYSVIKDRPYIVNIKGKVNYSLMKFALTKIIKKHSGKLVLATVSSIALLGTIHVIKNNDFNPIVDAPQIQVSEVEPIIENSTTTTEATTSMTQSTETTTTATTTTEPATTTTVMSAKEEQANDYFNHYCDMFEIYGEEKESLYLKNINKLVNDDNIEQAVIDLLYNYYSDNLYMQRAIYYNGYSEEEQEATILKYAKIKGITDENVLLTMLAVHKWETGHGTSDLCYYNNNLGGNVRGSEFQKYPNVEIGAIDFVNDFVRIMNNTYDPNMSLEQHMNPTYCTSDDEWYKRIAEMKQTLIEQDELTKVEEVLEEMLKKEKGKSYY